MSGEQTTRKKQHVKWASVLWYIHLHVLGLYAIWLIFTSAKWMTVVFTFFITAIGCLGVTAGAHRLWAHRTYSASSILRLFLMLAHNLTGVGPIHNWVLYHRLHHKYFGTDKDPYNHKKGFYYSHYVGNCLSPVVDYEQAQRDFDMRDIENDGYVWLQNKFYWPIFIIFGIILPLNAPLEYWDESMMETIMITGFLRFAITANVSFLVHSAPLIWGVKGNKLMLIPDTISLLYKLYFKMPKSHGTVIIHGQGVDIQLPLRDGSVFFIRKSFWPWYHYMLPWDWKSGEFGTYESGCTTFFIKMWRELGLISFVRTTDTEDIRKVLHRVAKKDFSLEKGLEQLQEISVYNAKKEKLLFRY